MKCLARAVVAGAGKPAGRGRHPELAQNANTITEPMRDHKSIAPWSASSICNGSTNGRPVWPAAGDVGRVPSVRFRPLACRVNPEARPYALEGGCCILLDITCKGLEPGTPFWADVMVVRPEISQSTKSRIIGPRIGSLSNTRILIVLLHKAC